MIRLLPGLLFTLIMGCKTTQEPYVSPIEPPNYFTIIKNNSQYVEFGVYADSYKDSLISMAMSFSSTDALYWQVNFGTFLKETQVLTLHKREIPPIQMYAAYTASCCLPPIAPEPDLLYYSYSIWTPDSIINKLYVSVNESTKELAGHFTATFVNDYAPYDTIKMECDTFYCKWE